MVYCQRYLWYIRTSNSRQALKDLVDSDDKSTVRIAYGVDGNPNRSVVNESGLYALIFGSRCKNAKKFKKWVTSVVLPTIRKTGSYNVSDDGEHLECINTIQRELKQFEWVHEYLGDILRSLGKNCEAIDRINRELPINNDVDKDTLMFIYNELIDMRKIIHDTSSTVHTYWNILEHEWIERTTVAERSEDELYGKYHNLSDTYNDLVERYNDVYDDYKKYEVLYDKLTIDCSNLQKSHDDLVNKYNDIKERYNATIELNRKLKEDCEYAHSMNKALLSSINDGDKSK